MTKLSDNTSPTTPSALANSSYHRGVEDGLEMAARMADRFSSLQQKFSEECGADMPESARAFLLQKVVARHIAHQIHDLIAIAAETRKRSDAE